MTDLTDLESKLRASQSVPCARFWARQLVQAQWEAGLIPVTHLSNEVFTEIVKQTVDLYRGKK